MFGLFGTVEFDLARQFVAAKLISINLDSSSSSKPRTFFKGEKVLFSVSFDEAVKVSPALWVNPSLDFLIGDRRVYASYQSGSTSKNLIFSYTVDADIKSLAAISIAKNPISANGVASNGGLPNLSSIGDSLGKNAALDFAGGPLAGVYFRSALPPIVAYNLAEDSGSSNSDRLTKNPTIAVSGVESGSSWQYSTDSGKTWTKGTGTSFNVSAGSYAAGQVRVKQADAAGNESSVNTSFAAFIVDGTPPAAAPSLALAADTGVLSSDRLTNNPTIVVSGLEAGGTWQFSTDSGKTWTKGTGTSFNVSAGSYAAGQVRVKQADAAGNESSVNTSFAAFSVDGTPPAAAPSLALAADTGVSSSDRLTNNPTIVVSGLEAGGTWQFSTDSGTTWTKGTGTSFNVSAGSYTAGQVRVKQADAAGNESSVNTSFAAFIVDTSSAPPSLALAADAGVSSSDRLTNNPAIVVSGLESGGTWQFSTDSGKIWTKGTGTSFNVSAGSYTAGQVRVKQADAAGNESSVNTSFAAFIVDTSSAPPSLALAADAGVSSSDRLTNNPAIVVSGLESGGTWQFSTDSGKIWTKGTGTSFNVSAGSYTAGQVRVKQADAAGNESSVNTSFAAFIVDGTPPAAAPSLALAADTGVSSSDRLTNNPTIVVSGLEAGGTWQFSTDSGKTWTKGTGTSFNVSAGSYTAGQVRVKQADAAGNESSDNASFAALLVDTSSAPPSLALAADAGVSSSDRLTNNPTIVVSGLEAGGTWQFSTDSGKTWTKGTGTSFNVSAGSYAAGQVRVKQADAAGNESSVNTSFAAFIVDGTPPAAAPSLALAADTGVSSSDRLTNNPTIVVSGLEAGGTWQFSTDSGKTWTKGTGTSFNVSAGSYTAGQVRVKQADAAGNESSVNSSFAAFIVDRTPPDRDPILALQQDTGISSSDRITNNSLIDVIVGYKVLYSGARNETIVLNPWSFSIDSGASWTQGTSRSIKSYDIDTGKTTIKSYLGVMPGSYGAGQVRVKETDDAGNEGNVNTWFAAFIVDKTPPAAPSLVLAADTGVSSSDRLTNNPTIVVSGLESGGIWFFSSNSGKTWTNGTGTSFNVSAGSYTAGQIRVVQRDAAGNESSDNASFAALLVDTSSDSPSLALAADAGVSSRDRLTNNPTIVVTELEAGGTWYFSSNSGKTWTKGTGTSFNVSAGSYTAGQVRVKQTDAAGNESSVNTSFAAFIVDGTPPAAAPSLALAADTGVSSSDRLTNNPTIVVTGLEAGGTWQFSTDSGKTWTQGTGTSFNVSAGSYTAGQVRVKQTDAAGNESSVNTSFAAFIVDTSSAPPSLALAADTGVSSSDRLTNNPTIVVSGLEAGGTWYFSSNSGTTWTKGTGTSFNVSAGSYTAGQVRVKQADAAGNESSVNTSFAAFIVDTSSASPSLALAADAGVSSSDRLTNNPTIVVSGLEAGGTWQFSTDSGKTWTKGTGTSFNVSAGSYTAGQVRVKQTDAAGNESSVNSSFAAFSVDGTPPAAAPSLALAADTGVLSSDRLTNNPTIVVSGLEAGGTWQFSTDSGKTWTKGTGTSFNVSAGSYAAGQVRVKQADAAGNESSVNQSFAAFTVDQYVRDPSISLAADTGSSKSDRLTNNGAINVGGLEVNSKWEYSLDSGKTWSLGVGNSFSVAKAQYTKGQVHLRQTDAAGNQSAVNSGLDAFRVMDWYDISKASYAKNMDNVDFRWANIFGVVSSWPGKISFKSSSSRLDNGKPTYVYSHGWQDSPTSNASTLLWQKMLARLGNTANVVFVDWSGLAKIDPTPPPNEEASLTDQVGQCVADALYGAGVDVSQLHLIGHSLGSYVSAAISKYINWCGKPASLTALDPAWSPNTYDLDARDGINDAGRSAFSSLAFSSLAKDSYSYVVSDLPGGVASSAGDNSKASTASRAYIVQYQDVRPGTWPTDWAGISTSYHNGVIGVYADLFSKGILRPENTAQNDGLNKYNENGIRVASGSFDGVVLAPQPWIRLPNEEFSKGGDRMAPNALGWFDGTHLSNSAKDDVIYVNKITDSLAPNVTVWASDGNDIIIGDRGIHTVDLGAGNDSIYFGYKRYATLEYAFDDGALGSAPWSGGGQDSYLIVKDFSGGDAAAGKMDKMYFPWSRGEIDAKLGRDYDDSLVKKYGVGTAIYKKSTLLTPTPQTDDLLAYCVGMNNGKNDFNWLVDTGRCVFEQTIDLDDSGGRLLNMVV